jgi:hypothetical protein
MKILRPEKTRFDAAAWVFYLEKDQWTYVNDIQEADVIPFMFHEDYYDIYHLKHMRPDQIALGLSIFHISEQLNEKTYLRKINELKEITPNVFIVHKNSMIKDVSSLVYYDCMFNMSKLFYTEYEKIGKIIDDGWSEPRWTTGTVPENFNLPDLEQKQPSDKVFINPGLMYGGFLEPRMRFRRGLNKHLSSNYSDIGFISNPNNILLPEPCSEDIKKFVNYKSTKNGGIWFPIGNSYYEKTYVSIYVETLTVTAYPTRCITEKTYDPLIKGHFILPFAYAGYIQELKDVGFKFPDFIDYSYDEIKNDEQRFVSYLHSVNKVMSLKDKMHDLFLENQDILQHNRNIFFNRPYDTLHDKVERQMNRINA